MSNNIQKVLSANLLVEGNCVWLDASGQWVFNIENALIARHDVAFDALKNAAEQFEKDGVVVNANLIEITEIDGVIVPNRLRERIRANGPTIGYGVANTVNLDANKAA